MYGFFKKGWAYIIMDDLDGVTNHTPFYQRKPNPLKEMTSVQKIITYRFIKNYQDAKTISDSK